MKAEEITLAPDLKEFSTQLEMVHLEMFMLFMVCLTALKMVAITIALA